MDSPPDDSHPKMWAAPEVYVNFLARSHRISENVSVLSKDLRHSLANA